jgi:hypothetical protein
VNEKMLKEAEIYASIISHLSFFIVSSAFPDSTVNVYSLLGVRSFSFTEVLSRFTVQDFALALIWMNFSTSVISAGMFFT